ncbi:methyltransferase domain-containing protein [Candidatus Woesearchaeota archaeon]|nr:methyltransferase domain-containing protein [Candidatus Woesearchaeota archaeon]
MESSKDAVGQLLIAHYRGFESYEILEREDGVIGLSEGPARYFLDYSQWPENEKQAIKHAKGKILDVGCGSGRFLSYLRKNGFNVLGIDNSPLAVEVCRLRGLKAKVLDLFDIDKLDEKFDTILMMWNNFGLFGSRDRVKNGLDLFYRMTNESSVIIADSTDPHTTNEEIHKEYHKLNIMKGRMSGQLRIRVRFKQYASNWFDYLLVSEQEMREVIDGTGWRLGTVYRCNSSSYIAILEKIC